MTASLTMPELLFAVAKSKAGSRLPALVATQAIQIALRDVVAVQAAKAPALVVMDDTRALACAVVKPGRVVDVLEWIPVTEGKLPDSAETVHIAIPDDGHRGEPAWLGYHDGECWRDTEGMQVEVSHYARMAGGPHATPR